MRETFARTSGWFAEGFLGFLVWGAYYLPPVVRPVAAALLLPVVLYCAFFRDSEKGHHRSTTSASLSLWLLVSCFVLGTISCLISWVQKTPGIKDIGVFVLEIVIPLILIFVPTRRAIVYAIVKWSVAFAVVDAVANILSVFGVVDLSGGSSYNPLSGESIVRHVGLIGSSLGAGLVALTATIYLILRIRDRIGNRLVNLGLLALVLTSLVLIGSRRHEVLALVCLVLVFLPAIGNRLNPAIVAAGTGILMLVMTFVSAASAISDNDAGSEILRASLLVYGSVEALNHPIIGAGLHYQDMSDAIPDVDVLSDANVTESQILDFAIAFGIPASALFFASVFIGLGFQRAPYMQLTTLVLITRGAEVFFGTAGEGGAGGILLIACLLCSLEPDKLFITPQICSAENGSV